MKKKCQNCGYLIKNNEEICPKCGTISPIYQIDSHYNSPSYNNNTNQYQTINIENPSIIKYIKLFFIMAFLFHFIVFLLICYITTKNIDTESYINKYCLTESGNIYYIEDYDIDTHANDVWRYNKNSKTWSIYDTISENSSYPKEIKHKNTKIYNLSEITKETGLDENDINILYSKEFIDDDNHLTPLQGYYYYNDNIYYFALKNDDASIDIKDGEGWYIYRNKKWEYFCKKTDKDILGEDLWYSDFSYFVSYNYEDALSYIETLGIDFSFVEFEHVLTSSQS